MNYQPESDMAPRKHIKAPLGSRFQFDDSNDYEQTAVKIAAISAPSPASAGAPRKVIIWQSTIIWAVSRVVIIIFTAIAAQSLGLAPHISTAVQNWYRWDAHWYINIAQNGYTNATMTAFFPLFPIILKIAATILPGHSYVLASLLLNSVFIWIGLVGLGFLAYSETADVSIVFPTILVFMAYPVIFFLSAPYTEALFTALAVWGLWAIRQKKWYLAAGLTFLTVLSRPTGIILYVPLLYECAIVIGKNKTIPVKDYAAGAVSLISAPLGLAVYSWYDFAKFGDPLAWLHAQSAWSHISVPIWQAIYEELQFYIHKPTSIDLVASLLLVGFIIFTYKKQPMSYTLYCVALLFLIVAAPIHLSYYAPGSASVTSAARYVIAAIPLFLYLGKLSAKHTTVTAIAVYGGLLLQGIFILRFLTGVWVN